MAIRPSASRAVRALVADLSSSRAAVVEAAVARLIVLGDRASDAVAALASDRRAPPAARAAALRVLESTAQTRGFQAALEAAGDEEAIVATAAIAALRPHLRGRRGAAAVDRLTTLALDRAQAPPLREAAVRLLLELEKRTVGPLRKALQHDPEPAIAALAAGDLPAPAGGAATVLAEAAGGTLPRDAEGLRRALAAGNAGPLSLSALLRLIQQIREREEAAADGHVWMAARGAAHAALARRGSRLAVYDLRETLQQARGPLPVAFLAALDLIGDQSCLEPLAAAYQSAAAAADGWWRARLAATFLTIVRRERLTRRHAAIQRLARRSPAVLDELWPRRGQ